MARQGFDVFEWIERRCTIPQIQNVLRLYKRDLGMKEVKIGAENKDGIISNLRRAVDGGFIDIGRVHELLSASEENGQQHIFYYKAKTPEAQQHASDGERTGRRLFGANWRESQGFPRFDLVVEDFTWANFRGQQETGHSNEWSAKLYGHEVRWEQVKITYEDNRRTRIERFKQVEDRVVCLARWNPPDLLEIRVSRLAVDSWSKIQRRLDKTWEHLAPALARNHFEEWNLGNCRRNLLQAAGENSEIYVIGKTRLTDSASGSAIISGNTVEEDIAACPERRGVIDLYMASGSVPTLTVQWDKDGISSGENLLTILSQKRSNQLTIEASASAVAVDNVTNQLRAFN